MKGFWNSEITAASWNALQDLNKEYEFTLIGGWAVYLYTKLQKSKDIDIVVDYPVLRQLESRYRVVKNDRLSKYEVRQEMFDIDVHLPNYSRLAIPARELMGRYATRIEGFRVPVPEALMVLKLGAFSDRSGSTKGAKDAIDMLGLLFYSGLEVKKLKETAEGHGMPDGIRVLERLLRRFDAGDLKYLNLNVAGFSKLKRRYLEEMRAVL